MATLLLPWQIEQFNLWVKNLKYFGGRLINHLNADYLRQLKYLIRTGRNLLSRLEIAWNSQLRGSIKNDRAWSTSESHEMPNKGATIRGTDIIIRRNPLQLITIIHIPVISAKQNEPFNKGAESAGLYVIYIRMDVYMSFIGISWLRCWLTSLWYSRFPFFRHRPNDYGHVAERILIRKIADQLIPSRARSTAQTMPPISGGSLVSVSAGRSRQKLSRAGFLCVCSVLAESALAKSLGATQHHPLSWFDEG